MARLALKVREVAGLLERRAIIARACTVRLPLADVVRRDRDGRLLVDDRLAAGCRLAIYDALVEACEDLDSLREQIGLALADGDDEGIAARYAEVRRRRQLQGEDAATDCGDTAEEPASHGAASGPAE